MFFSGNGSPTLSLFNRRAREEVQVKIVQDDVAPGEAPTDQGGVFRKKERRKRTKKNKNVKERKKASHKKKKKKERKERKKKEREGGEKGGRVGGRRAGLI